MHEGFSVSVCRAVFWIWSRRPPAQGVAVDHNLLIYLSILEPSRTAIRKRNATEEFSVEKWACSQLYRNTERIKVTKK